MAKMIEHANISLSEGHLALKAGDWARANICFEAALAQEESPEAHDGLGIALWWANSVEQAHEHRATAYRGFKQRGELARRRDCSLARARTGLSERKCQRHERLVRSG